MWRELFLVIPELSIRIESMMIYLFLSWKNVRAIPNAVFRKHSSSIYWETNKSQALRRYNSGPQAFSAWYKNVNEHRSDKSWPSETWKRWGNVNSACGFPNEAIFFSLVLDLRFFSAGKTDWETKQTCVNTWFSWRKWRGPNISQFQGFGDLLRDFGKDSVSRKNYGGEILVTYWAPS